MCTYIADVCIYVYIYIYIYIYIYTYWLGSLAGNRTYIMYPIYSPNQLSFWSPGGVVRGLYSGHRAKICAWELASVAYHGLQGPPVVSRGLQWSPAF